MDEYRHLQKHLKRIEDKLEVNTQESRSYGCLILIGIFFILIMCFVITGSF